MNNVRIKCRLGSEILSLLYDNHEITVKNLKDDVIKTLNGKSFMIMDKDMQTLSDDQKLVDIDSDYTIQLIESDVIYFPSVSEISPIEESIIVQQLSNELEDNRLSGLIDLKKFLENNTSISKGLNHSISSGFNLIKSLNLFAELRLIRDNNLFYIDPSQNISLMISIHNRSLITLLNYKFCLSFSIESKKIVLELTTHEEPFIRPGNKSKFGLTFSVTEYLKKSNEIRGTLSMSSPNCFNSNKLELLIRHNLLYSSNQRLSIKLSS